MRVLYFSLTLVIIFVIAIGYAPKAEAAPGRKEANMKNIDLDNLKCDLESAVSINHTSY